MYFLSVTICIVLVWGVAWLVVLFFRYRATVIGCWKEPVLRRPVVIFESDDWGPGADNDASQLAAIAGILGKYNDSAGRHPVMTLGVVLAVPDGEKMTLANCEEYARITLGKRQFSNIVECIRNGVRAGVFDVQLHGMEHYWPDNLLDAMGVDDDVRALVLRPDVLRTEQLPSALQCRWTRLTDVGVRALSDDDIQNAVRTETAYFEEVFQRSASVVVPPRFLWNPTVEAQWAGSGVNYLVTPGVMYTGINDHGKLVIGRTGIFNGQVSDAGLVYLVRNDYFEPSLGHTADNVLAAVAEKTRLGRPTLLEIHRFNFCDSASDSKTAFNALEHAIQSVLKNFPDVVFLSTQELGDYYCGLTSDREAFNKNGLPSTAQSLPTADLLNVSLTKRIAMFLERIWAQDALRKWFYVSGLFLIIRGLSLGLKAR